MKLRKGRWFWHLKPWWFWQGWRPISPRIATIPEIFGIPPGARLALEDLMEKTKQDAKYWSVWWLTCFRQWMMVVQAFFLKDSAVNLYLYVQLLLRLLRRCKRYARVILGMRAGTSIRSTSVSMNSVRFHMIFEPLTKRIQNSSPRAQGHSAWQRDALSEGLLWLLPGGAGRWFGVSGMCRWKKWSF